MGELEVNVNERMEALKNRLNHHDKLMHCLFGLDWQYFEDEALQAQYDDLREALHERIEADKAEYINLTATTDCDAAMSRRECERKIIALLEQVYEIYRKYNPQEHCLSMYACAGQINCSDLPKGGGDSTIEVTRFADGVIWYGEDWAASRRGEIVEHARERTA